MLVRDGSLVQRHVALLAWRWQAGAGEAGREGCWGTGSALRAAVPLGGCAPPRGTQRTHTPTAQAPSAPTDATSSTSALGLERQNQQPSTGLYTLAAAAGPELAASTVMVRPSSSACGGQVAGKRQVGRGPGVCRSGMPIRHCLGMGAETRARQARVCIKARMGQHTAHIQQAQAASQATLTRPAELYGALHCLGALKLNVAEAVELACGGQRRTQSPRGQWSACMQLQGRRAHPALCTRSCAAAQGRVPPRRRRCCDAPSWFRRRTRSTTRPAWLKNSTMSSSVALHSGPARYAFRVGCQ